MKLIPKAEAIQICSDRDIPLGPIHPDVGRAMTQEERLLRAYATTAETNEDIPHDRREKIQRSIELHEAALELAKGA